MGIQLDLLLNAISAGILLGGFYAAVSVGVAISFGMLDIANLAHPAFIILGSFIAYTLNAQFGIDPIIGGILALPAFYLLFGILFITEVGLILVFGVDYRFVAAPYIGPSIHLGLVDVPLRMTVPFIFSLLMVGGLQLYLSRTFIGRAILAVSQDSQALRLMAINPTKVKRVAFALSIATAAMAGSFLIIIQPVEPSVGREYIGRVFAIVVLGGMGSFPGMMIASMLLGVFESITATFYGPSWSPAVAFGFLLIALAVKPSGLMGR